MADWNAVVFTDEKKWNLAGPDGFYTCLVESKRNVNFSRIEGVRGGLMVWGAIAASGPIVLVPVEGRLNSEKYIELIEKNLFSNISSLECPFPANSIFQQDNAPCHASQKTFKWLENSNIETLPWPPQSPDLSPIEDVWGLLTQRVYKGGITFKNKKDLWAKVKSEWDKLTAVDMAPLYDSMHKRMLDVLQKQGKQINYSSISERQEPIF